MSNQLIIVIHHHNLSSLFFLKVKALIDYLIFKSHYAPNLQQQRNVTRRNTTIPLFIIYGDEKWNYFQHLRL